MKPIALPLVLTGLFIVIFIPLQTTSAQEWYNDAWQYRQKITVSSALSNSNLTDFPYLVKITSPGHLIFAQAQLDGDDILFTDSIGTKLDHEIEKFSTSSKEFFAWVRIPTISSSTNTSIYIYFGNPLASNQQNIQGVWNNGYVMVQHLNETSGTHFDATFNSNDGTPSGSINQNASGQIDGADSFDGTDGKVLMSDAVSLRIVDMTLEAWVYIPASIPESWCTIVEHGRSTDNWYGLWKSGNDGYQDRFHFRWSTGSVRRVDFSTSLSPDSWYHVVGTLKSSTATVNAYLNGNLDTLVSGASLSIADSGLTTIGITNVTNEAFTGIIDEVRISSIALSADWIKATYRNHAQTDSFQTVGDQESNPTPVELISFNGKVRNNVILLTWKTATEVNNYGFEIERALSSTSHIRVWEKIGFVDGNGNSNSPKEYSFEDNNTYRFCTYYYRLKQIDNDGTFSFSNTVSVLFEQAPIKFKLQQNYPNPFNPSTTIYYSLPEESSVRITIYDVLGNEVMVFSEEKQVAGYHKIDFDATEYPSGVYFYRLRAGEFVETKKMILLR